MPGFLIVLLLLLLLVPVALTLYHFVQIFSKKPKNDGRIASLTLISGFFLTILLYYIMNFQDYNNTLVLVEGDILQHAPIASQYQPLILSLMVVSMITYFILNVKGLRIPPLPLGLLLSILYIGCFTCFLWLIQLLSFLSWNFYFVLLFLLCLFPLNFILLTISLLKKLMKSYTLLHTEENSFLPPSVFQFMIFSIHKSLRIPLLGFICLIPVCAIFLLLLILFNQEPDALIKAFTQTSDWCLSSKESLFVIEPRLDDHYLCTVAVGGHKKIVKPMRYGIRHHRKIIVNRQLCIANAFEDLIMQKAPSFHRYIRHFYDTYGFPIAKLIRTPLLADITYILMKPLEWCFLITLYCFDLTPETRICRQYLPLEGKKTNNQKG